MTSLKDFLNQKHFKEKNTEHDFNNIPKEDVNNIEENLKKYQSMSQNDLMSELVKEAGRMKANGSLNESSLENLKSTLSPMLNDQQKNMLDSILDQIK